MNQSVGIDVGKRELVLAIRDPDGTVATRAPFPNTSIGLKKLIVHLQECRINTEDPILLESTGPYHWKPAHTLADSGFFVKVANPLHTKQMARYSIRKRKTDKVDAGHLAYLAIQGYGYPFRDTEDLAYKKALVRHYWKLKSVAAQMCMHEDYLHEFHSIKGFRVTPALTRMIETLKNEIVNGFQGNDLRYLDTIPGISPLLGATIPTELVPLDRFTRIDQIVAYAGLDPSVKQSGGRPSRYGRLSKRGSPILRRALFLAAFGSFSHPPFQDIYRRYKARGLHHTVILCILARKILRICVTLLKKRREFDSRYLDGT